MQNELLLGSRAAALREVVRSLECDAATRAFLDQFLPGVPGIKPYVPLGATGCEHLLGALAAAGAGFSIRSLADLDIANALGVDARALLYTGTSSDTADAREAALCGVWRFAIRSQHDLVVLGGATPGAAVYVYIGVQGAGGDATQGASAHEALRLLRAAPECGLRPYGLAFNVGNTAVDAETYARAVDRCGLVMRRLEQLGTRLEMLSFGGALSSDARDPAVLASVARLPYRPPLLVAEP